ncbi:hypothetical protein KKC88_06175 [Patescibacteria group bacterium]|nr:hypothetical protein [Patescibacteria group bacterium]MBU1673931.1 hypothetical protein [Patescibacteria group bacterium]MBU1963925.1 hypothetical protein [Patescibacteria group bacterium]
MEATLQEEVVQLAAKEKEIDIPKIKITAPSDETNKKETEKKEETKKEGTKKEKDSGKKDTEEITIQTSDIKSFKDIDFKNLDYNNPTWDMMLVGFFVVGALLYGLSLGRDRIISILMSIYIALAVTAALPDVIVNVNLQGGFAFQITTFLAVFVGMFFLMSRMALSRSLSLNSDGGIIQTVVFSFLHVGLIIAVAMSFMPPEILSKFSPLTIEIFTNQWAYFGWIIAPIVAMIVLGRKGVKDD